MDESNMSNGPEKQDEIMTNSARQILKWMKNYASLMRPLNSRSEDIFNGMCELFDIYFMEIFLFVSGISLEALVWQDVNLIKSVVSK